MKRILTVIAATVPLVLSFIACDESSIIGNSIAEDAIGIYIDSSFCVTGTTARIDSVQSRTVSQLIGRIDAKGYGKLSSDVVTQFMAASNIDTTTLKEDGIDSLKLSMYITKGEFVGDSVVPMGIEVYRLNKQLPSPIYSNLDPADYYSPTDKLGSTIYNLAANTNGATTDGSTLISVKLPLSLAKDLYRSYVADPSSFNTPSSFAKVFPGIYIKNSYGSGRFSRVTRTLMTMYYHYGVKTSDGRDSTLYATGNYFAVTPEIITNNNISLEISSDINDLVAKGENIVMAPAGLEVNIKFPALDIIEAFEDGNNPVKVLNSVQFSIPGEYIPNPNAISQPQYLLLVLKKDKDQFFAKNTLPDNITSFYATYNSSTGLYDFGEMRQYIKNLMAKTTPITEEDYTFSITPVSAIFETQNSSYYNYYYGSTQQQTLTMLTPYVASPVMARLLLDKAKIKLTYSKQTISAQ